MIVGETVPSNPFGLNTKLCEVFRCDEPSKTNRLCRLHYDRTRPKRKRKRAPTNSTYHLMKNRCSNPNNPSYKWYGARGIHVCARWINSYPNFLEDMGEKPEGTSIDRIDPDGNYEPGNCRWSTPMEQTHNRRKRKK